MALATTRCPYCMSATLHWRAGSCLATCATCRRPILRFRERPGLDARGIMPLDTIILLGAGALLFTGFLGFAAGYITARATTKLVGTYALSDLKWGKLGLMDVDRCAAQAIHALVHRRSFAIPGMGNRLTYLASRAPPRSLVSRLAALPYRRPQ